MQGLRPVAFYDAELARPERASRAAFWTGWVLSALPALFLLVGSVSALRASPQVVEGTSRLGYLPGFCRSWPGWSSAAPCCTSSRGRRCWA